jgi:hypothetical protein
MMQHKTLHQLWIMRLRQLITHIRVIRKAPMLLITPRKLCGMLRMLRLIVSEINAGAAHKDAIVLY